MQFLRGNFLALKGFRMILWFCKPILLSNFSFQLFYELIPNSKLQVYPLGVKAKHIFFFRLIHHMLTEMSKEIKENYYVNPCGCVFYIWRINLMTKKKKKCCFCCCLVLCSTSKILYCFFLPYESSHSAPVTVYVILHSPKDPLLD